MVFPGVLRGRPGPRLATTLANRPRRSLSSPRMLVPVSLAARPPSAAGAEEEKNDAAPGHFEDLSTRPEGPASAGARPHPSMASLFAYRFRVEIQLSSPRKRAQERFGGEPAFCAKKTS